MVRFCIWKLSILEGNAYFSKSGNAPLSPLVITRSCVLLLIQQNNNFMVISVFVPHRAEEQVVFFNLHL